MAIQTNKYDYIYGKLLGLNFSIDHAKQLAKSLYDISDELDLTADAVLKHVTSDGIRFDNAIYTKLNTQRTNSSQIGFVDSGNIPRAILQQIPNG